MNNIIGIIGISEEQYNMLIDNNDNRPDNGISGCRYDNTAIEDIFGRLKDLYQYMAQVWDK